MAEAPQASERTAVATSKDGTRIGAAVAGLGPGLVLVHGTTADHTRWRGIVPHLARRRTVYAMDRRGRGLSGDAPSYAFGREFEDVAAVVELAASETGAPVDVLGHSWGAVCSLGGALRTQAIRRLAVYEPPLVPDESTYPADFLARIDALVAAGRREEALEAFFTEVVRMPPAELALLRSKKAWEARVAAAHTLVRECRRPAGLPIPASELARIQVPVLVLEGGSSPRFLREAAQLVHRSIPQSRMATMPGQQHAAMDTAPELFLREVDAFFV